MRYGVCEADQPSPQQMRLEKSQVHNKSQVALTFFVCQLVRILMRVGTRTNLQTKNVSAT